VGEGDGPRLLVTGFGPFPGAPENPTEQLIRALAHEPPQTFGAADFRAVVLPTDYRRSWQRLRRLYARLDPDIVVHFGLSDRADRIRVERIARRTIDPSIPDAADYTPRSGRAARAGPDALEATLPVDALVAALSVSGIGAASSDDAGAYVCNATLYRSLAAAPASRHVGFVHVPPAAVMPASQLFEAALLLLRATTSAGR